MRTPSPAILVSIAIAAALVIAAPAQAIVGGQAVKRGHYGFTVAIVTSGNKPWVDGQYCGGTLIAPRVVLTAAHCLDDTDPANDATAEDIQVLVGSTDLRGGTLIDAAALVVHPKFSILTVHYDAALIVLAEDARVFGARVLPMADVTPHAGSTVSTAGWGWTNENPNRAATPMHLHSVIVKTLPLSECNAGEDGFWSVTMICASKPGRDSCLNDSGGPLVGYASGRLAVIGVTSFGEGCAEAKHPGVYTRVSAVRGWALTQLAKVDSLAA